jgi:hypothetical protein
MIRIVFGLFFCCVAAGGIARAPVAETIALAYSQALERNHELPQAREVLETSLKSHPDQFSIRLHCRPSKSSTTPMFPGKIPKCLSCSQQLASNSANKLNQAARSTMQGRSASPKLFAKSQLARIR